MKIKKKYLYTFLFFLGIALIWFFFFRTPAYDLPVQIKPLLGNADAPVDIVEFSDLQCPYCKQAHEEALRPLIREYPDEIKFTFRHFPISSVHPMAFKAAEASECANDQGKFWEYVDAVYANQDKLSLSTLRMIAKNMALDLDLFNTCFDSGVRAQIVQMEQRMGNQQGVSSTPTFFVNGELLADWRYPSFKAKIDSILGKKTEELPEEKITEQEKKIIPEEKKEEDNTPDVGQPNLLAVTR